MTGWYVKFIYAILGKLTSLSLNKVKNKSQGPVPRKMVKLTQDWAKNFKQGFLVYKHATLAYKYCWAITPR